MCQFWRFIIYIGVCVMYVQMTTRAAEMRTQKSPLKIFHKFLDENSYLSRCVWYNERIVQQLPLQI